MNILQPVMQHFQIVMRASITITMKTSENQRLFTFSGDVETEAFKTILRYSKKVCKIFKGVSSPRWNSV